jgi:hypothetical protein
LRRRLGTFEFNYDTARVVDYGNYYRRILATPSPPYRRFRSAMPAWDNTPRMGRNATIVRGSTPTLFRQWLEALVREARATGGETLLFLNAWNEWGEGNHLEPCQRWGHAYLEAVSQAVHSKEADARRVAPPAEIP